MMEILDVIKQIFEIKKQISIAESRLDKLFEDLLKEATLESLDQKDGS